MSFIDNFIKDLASIYPEAEGELTLYSYRMKLSDVTLFFCVTGKSKNKTLFAFKGERDLTTHDEVFENLPDEAKEVAINHMDIFLNYKVF